LYSYACSSASGWGWVALLGVCGARKTAACRRGASRFSNVRFGWSSNARNCLKSLRHDEHFVRGEPYQQVRNVSKPAIAFGASTHPRRVVGFAGAGRIRGCHRVGVAALALTQLRQRTNPVAREASRRTQATPSALREDVGQKCNCKDWPVAPVVYTSYAINTIAREFSQHR